MKEEEIIKQLNSLILEKRYYTEYHAWVGTKTFEAIQGLLDLYEKEKEKNKELKKPKWIIDCKTGEVTKIHNDYISKDKIREKIKVIENDCEKCRYKGEICKELTNNNQCVQGESLKLLEQLLEEE